MSARSHSDTKMPLQVLHGLASIKVQDEMISPPMVCSTLSRNSHLRVRFQLEGYRLSHHSQILQRVLHFQHASQKWPQVVAFRPSSLGRCCKLSSCSFRISFRVLLMASSMLLNGARV